MVLSSHGKDTHVQTLQSSHSLLETFLSHKICHALPQPLPESDGHVNGMNLLMPDTLNSFLGEHKDLFAFSINAQQCDYLGSSSWNTEITQVVEILPHGRQGTVYPA